MLELQNHLYVLDADLQVRLAHLHKLRCTVVAVLQEEMRLPHRGIYVQG